MFLTSMAVSGYLTIVSLTSVRFAAVREESEEPIMRIKDVENKAFFAQFVAHWSLAEAAPC